jgi:O-antigen/teichoic acid export membrane protein
VTTAPDRPVARSAGYLVATVAGMMMPFVTLPIMTRWLTPADYGVMALGQIVASLFGGVASLGAGAGLERSYYRYEGDARALGRLLHSGLALVTGCSLALALVLFVVRDSLAALLLGDARWGLLLVALSVTSALGVLSTVQFMHLRNRDRVRAFMGLTIGGLVLESTVAVVLVVAGGLGVWGLALGGLLGKLVVVAVMWVGLARELRPGFDAAMMREVLGVGLPLVPRSCVGVISTTVDRLVLGWLGSLGQVGIYGMANRIGYSMFALTAALDQVFIPRMYRLMFQGGTDSAARIGRFVSPYLCASVVGASLVTLFTEELLWALVTPAFYGVWPVAAVLATYYGAMFFGKVSGIQFIHAKKTWYGTPLSVLRLALQVPLAVALIGGFGALGAAFSLLISGIVVDGIAFVLGQRHYRVAYEPRVALALLAVLYVAPAWVLGSAALDAAYGWRLAGKLAIAAIALAQGRRWFRPVVEQVVTAFRGERTAVAA